MRELRLTGEQLKELVEQYDIHMGGMEFFLDVSTGEILFFRDYDRDEEDEELIEKIDEGFNEIYFRIPARDSDEGYEDMCAFAGTVSDDLLRNRLYDALNARSKVFRRFKDVLAADDDEQQRYYSFLEERNRERIMEWLESIGMKVIVEEVVVSPSVKQFSR